MRNLSIYLFGVLMIAFLSFSQTFAQQTNLKWLLKYSGKSTNEVVWDKRFNNFLVSVTPKIKLDLGTGERDWLKDTVGEFIGGPPDMISITENKIVILSACRAHSCPEKAWLWCDTKKGLVIGAVIHYVFHGKDTEASLLLFSNQLSPDSFPEQSKKDLENWLKEKELAVKVRRFVGKNRKIIRLKEQSL